MCQHISIWHYCSLEIIQLILISTRSQAVRKYFSRKALLGAHYCVQINFVSRGKVMTLDRYYKKKTVLTDPRQFTPQYLLQ